MEQYWHVLLWETAVYSFYSMPQESTLSKSFPMDHMPQSRTSLHDYIAVSTFSYIVCLFQFILPMTSSLIIPFCLNLFFQVCNGLFLLQCIYQPPFRLWFNIHASRAVLEQVRRFPKCLRCFQKSTGNRKVREHYYASWAEKCNCFVGISRDYLIYLNFAIILA